MAADEVYGSEGDTVSTAAYVDYDAALVVDGSRENVAWWVGIYNIGDVSGSGSSDGWGDSSDSSVVE